MRATIQTAFAVTALLLLPVSRASADPVTVRGFFVADPEDVPGYIAFDFSGIVAGEAFRAVSGHGPNGGAVPAPPGVTYGCLHACAPGSTFDFSNATADGLQPFGIGTLTRGGVTYDDVLLSGSVAIRSPGAIVPQPPTDPDDRDQEFPVISAPFTFTGALSARDDRGAPLFSVDLIGGGLAQTMLVWDGSTFFRIEEAATIGYGFSSPSPTPEPASLLLVASGLSACVGARRRARRTHPDGRSR
ncbi:MAG TPA: PEP-CTERM sorting domain-containing protein [Vicinamibacterales bacterium]|nr:PEP-CTERM sorting domain-containing protein [Vicinamibacterales bacterium]